MMWEDREINKKVAMRPGLVRRRMHTTLRVAIGTACGIFAIVLLLYIGNTLLQRFLHNPRFRVRRVFVQNTTTLSAPDVLRLANITENMNIYALSLDAMAQRVMQHPDVRSVHISKRPPDKLIIQVEERTPVAIILTGPHEEWNIPIDADGVMLSQEKMSYALDKPQIQGSESIHYAPGSTVRDERIHTALSFISALRHAPSTVFVDVSGINIQEPETIILRTRTIDEVVIGREFTPETVLMFLATVDDLRFKRINAQRIDLRFKDVIVTPYSL